MHSLRSFLLTSFLACTIAASAQDNYEMSKPIKVRREGVNKLLCLHNGSTALLHFEKARSLELKIFDSTHKQIANRTHGCRHIDENMLSSTAFKGLFEINNEIVLFIDQEHLTKHQLVRVRFSGRDGKKIEEKVLGESPGVSKHTRFLVMKNRNEDNYAVLFATDAPQYYTCDIKVGYYNAQHEQVRETVIPVERKKYDYLDVLSAEALPNGLGIAIGLSKMKINGDPALSVMEASNGDRLTNINRNNGLSRILVGGAGSTLEAAAIYDHYTSFYYLPNDSGSVRQTTIDVSTEVQPYYGAFTYNPFAKTVNAVMLSYRDALYRFGIEIRPTALVDNLFF